MEKHFNLSEHGIAFATREKGCVVGEEIKNTLISINATDTLIIHGEGVKAVSYSFMDELLARIMDAWARPEHAEKKIALAEWEEPISQAFKTTQAQRHLTLNNCISLNHLTKRQPGKPGLVQ
jgi:hypothetical protein